MSTQNSKTPTPLKRINPSEIPDLFVKHKLEPAYGNYILPESMSERVPKQPDCGCLDGLLCLIEAGGIEAATAIVFPDDQEYGSIYDFLASTGYTVEYVAGLCDGWEAFSFQPMRDENEYDLGYTHGEQAREACIAAGILKRTRNPNE